MMVTFMALAVNMLGAYLVLQFDFIAPNVSGWAFVMASYTVYALLALIFVYWIVSFFKTFFEGAVVRLVK